VDRAAEVSIIEFAGQGSNSCTKVKGVDARRARTGAKFNKLPNPGFGHSFAIGRTSEYV